MDFKLTEEQIALQRMVENFAKNEVAPGVAERDEKGSWDGEIWRRMGELGLLGLPIPEEYGGGVGALNTVPALEAFARASGDSGILASWGLIW